MDTWRSAPTVVPGIISRVTAIVALLLLSACSMFAPEPAEPEPVAEVVPQPIPVPPAQPQPAPDPVVEQTPDLPSIPVAPVEPQNIEPLIAVVIADRNPAYVSVAEALAEFLDTREVYDLSDPSMPASAAFDVIGKSDAKAVVAIGLAAAQAARRFSSVPVVMGQVFNLRDHDLLSTNTRAVQALPPVALQIDAWLEIDPQLKMVGAILGPGHDVLLAETEAAMKSRGVQFHHVTATTDRQTLYVFNRMVRDLDGFVLFPDNRILSRNVIGEMMQHAQRQQVQIAVFNEPLLEYGAILNAGTVPADIAGTIAEVLEQILKGKIAAVPPVTALSQIDVTINPAVANRLGLPIKPDGTIASIE